MKSIATYAPAFLTYNNLVLARVVRWLTQLLVDHFFFAITIINSHLFMVMVLFVAAGHQHISMFHVYFPNLGKKTMGEQVSKCKAEYEEQKEKLP